MDGFAVSRNMPDLRRLPLGRFCSFVWWYATRNAEDQAERARFEALLWRPPAGEVASGPWAPEAETAGLQALKAGLATS